MKAEIFNNIFWVEETQPQTIKKTMERLLVDSGLTIVGFAEHHFKPQGYTCVWIIAESHLAVHTFPEKGKSYIELSSCNLAKQIKFLELFKKEFGYND